MRGAAAVAFVWLVLAGCGGAHRATVQVGVSDASGQPLQAAQVWIDGSDLRATTDATGNATLKGVGPGVYQVEAGVNGYFREHATVTVESKGDPTPVALTLSYAPPTGSFFYQPKSTEWIVLSIDSLNPFRAVLYTYEWACWSQGWNQHSPQQVELGRNELTFGYGSMIPIVGPEQLGTTWKNATSGNGFPDVTAMTEPPGACNGSSAAWDNTSSG